MGSPTRRIERIAYARDWVINHDYLERQCAGCNSADGFQGLLSASAAFTVTIERRSRTIDDPVSIAQYLRRFGDSLSKVWGTLNRLSVENKFRVNKAESVAKGRRRLFQLAVECVNANIRRRRGGRGRFFLLAECVRTAD